MNRLFFRVNTENYFISSRPNTENKNNEILFNQAYGIINSAINSTVRSLGSSTSKKTLSSKYEIAVLTRVKMAPNIQYNQIYP